MFLKFLVFAITLLSFNLFASPNAETLLKSSDRSRGGMSEGLVWDLKIISTSQEQSSEFTYQIKAKENFVLAKCLTPARSKDEVYLFLDKNLWIHRPGLKKPMSLSVKQKLIGQAANGDIATTNYFRDYTPKVVGEDVVSGVKTWKLNLKAKSNDVTYDQINYWISQDKMLGVQAEYLTLQNEVFKRATFEYKNQIAKEGKSIPFISKLTIIDAKDSKLKSELIYSQPKMESLGDALFNVNKLGK